MTRRIRLDSPFRRSMLLSAVIVGSMVAALLIAFHFFELTWPEAGKILPGCIASSLSLIVSIFALSFGPSIPHARVQTRLMQTADGLQLTGEVLNRLGEPMDIASVEVKHGTVSTLSPFTVNNSESARFQCTIQDPQLKKRLTVVIWYRFHGTDERHPLHFRLRTRFH